LVVALKANLALLFLGYLASQKNAFEYQTILGCQLGKTVWITKQNTTLIAAQTINIIV